MTKGRRDARTWHRTTTLPVGQHLVNVRGSSVPTRLVPGLAALSCACGLLALQFPIVRQDVALLEGVDSLTGLKTTLDRIDLSLAAVPFLGALLTAIFLALTVLPVIDLCTGRPRLTGLLTAPALLGLVLIVPLVGSTIGITGFGGLLSGIALDGVLDVRPGLGAVLLVLAEVGLLVLGPVALVLWWRHRPGRSPRC